MKAIPQTKLDINVLLHDIRLIEHVRCCQTWHGSIHYKKYENKIIHSVK